MDIEQAKKALVNAHNAGDVDAARQIATFITQQQKAPTKEISQGQAALSSYIRNIPFGTDIASAIAAPITSIGANIPLSDAYGMAKESFMEDVAAGQEQYPITTGAAGLTGAIASGLAIPANYYQGASMLSSALKGGGIAAGLGFGYGAQEGDNLSEKIGSGIYEGAVAAPFGAGGSVLADLLTGGTGAVQRQAQAIANNSSPITQSAVAAPVAGQGGDDTLRAIRLGLNEVPDTALQAGKQIPLSQGQLTQSPRLQSLEYGAQGGMYGDEARALAMQSREIQSDAAKKSLNTIAGRELGQDVPFDAGDAVLKNIQSAYKSAKAKTNKFYGGVREMTKNSGAPLTFEANYVKESIVPALKNWKSTGIEGGFDLGAPEMANAKRLYEKVVNFAQNKDVSKINYTALESWRGAVSQGAANAKTPVEKRFFAGMLENFDTAMKQIPREAIKSGDERILALYDKARGARAMQGKLFERNKLVADILERDAITSEQMSNMLFQRQDAPLRLKAIVKAVGPQKAPEVLTVAKQGNLASILKKSLAAEMKEGQVAENMISFDKLHTNLNRFINDQPTLFKTLHPDPAEQLKMRQLLEDVNRIKSVKPGSKNYSNTAYTFLSLLQKVSPALASTSVPLFGSIGGATETVAKAGATAELSKSLQPVLQDTIAAMEGPLFNFTEKFGRPALVSATSYKARE